MAQVEGGIDMEEDDIPREAAYMALRKEPKEVRKGSAPVVHKGLGEVDLPRWVYWGLVLKRHQLGASSQLMDQSKQNLEGLEGLRHLFPMPSPSRNQQVYPRTQKIIVPKRLPKFEGARHQDPNKVSFLQPSVYICDVQAISQSFRQGTACEVARDMEQSLTRLPPISEL